MRVLITGAGGFIGRTLTSVLLQAGALTNAAGISETIEELLLLDTHLPPASDPRVRHLQADIDAPDTLKKIAAWKPHSVFHLAAVLTSAAEQDPARAGGECFGAGGIDRRHPRERCSAAPDLSKFDRGLRRVIA
ncbi:NAD-dependent epimerase/dehydratase family protein [Tardiphaga sp. 42S5]|uniref:NAD-dependent epimerase/dehydratase family protein n=1 Tax=Tardiphaga sp. 42S5 TaxID=1404799 RepID=UPI002A59B7BE|nr:NAD-dependent epimerase/dehydratase family protein [Tardiphaga sp. 42S5]WPO38922.1 NAD-dependent epimerase/dehydratase family protein [Tardiphaga sp. 42S5]